MLMLFIGTILTAQTETFKSIHQIEWEEHLNDDEHHQLQKPAVVAVDPLQERDPDGPQLTHAIFGYLPDWEYVSAPPILIIPCCPVSPCLIFWLIPRVISHNIPTAGPVTG